MVENPGGTGKILLGTGMVLLLVLMTPVLLFMGGSERQAADPLGPCLPPGENGTHGTDTTSSVPEQYREALDKAARTAGLPASLLAAQIKQESGWNPRAVSPVGAKGLAQFMPQTWAEYGNGKDPFDPFAALDAQGRYMKYLVDVVSALATSETQKIEFALAAYNAGPGNVQTYGGIPPFSETRDYVTKIMESSQVDYSSSCEPPGGFEFGDLGPGDWVNPLPGSRLTSPFGTRPCPLSSCAGRPFLLYHEGIDLAGGDEMFYAPTDMEITYVSAGASDRLYGVYGNYIFAKQTQAPYLVFEFHEARDNSLLVETGDIVRAGTPLGAPGATGNSSGVHLHFQINRPDTTSIYAPAVNNGKSLDPMPYLREKGISFQ
ncbi:transglycosylase SLT domain-containing protein [Paeniglutamicibacter sulfureus]|uniref:transglycosylase SLT domain-containing protein n=1 Tax=Paeniglutamicibacter sulfureus TaxID=43666 RepID=UPI0026656D83|nr:transglycosylase SLT domain-containing protein [Paeniglutamicibacter sulfureus]MDO2934196.1 transglycosylase SLT domain-containing protein [Paeniglutamicibacter sulfureus]